MPKELKVTTADEWRTAHTDGELLSLPSGRVARIRCINVIESVLDGEIPDPLTPVALKVFGGAVGLADSNEAPSYPDELSKIRDGIGLIGAVVRLAFMEPRIANGEPEPGEITLRDITMEDRDFVYAYSTGLVPELRSFRRKQERAVAAVQAKPRGKGKAKRTP